MSFKSPAHDCARAVGASASAAAQAASAESVVRERNRLNKPSVFKDLVDVNPESWRVVMCGSSQKGH